MSEVRKVPISDVIVQDRHRRDLGEIDSLAVNIRDIGLLQPIGITQDHRLVFGGRRLAACREILNWTEIDAIVVDVPSIVDGEFAENEFRKSFTPSERIAIGKAIEKEIGDRQGKRTDKLVAHGPQVDEGKTRELAAKKAGFSSTTQYRRAKKVVEDAEPEVVEAMDSGELSIRKAHDISKLPPEMQKRLDAAEAELRRQKKLAGQERKQREEAEDRAKKATLLAEALEQNQEAMRIKASEDAKSKALAELEKLQDELVVLRSEQDSKANEIAEAKLKEQQDAVDRLKKQERETKSKIQNMEDRDKRLKKRVAKQEDYINRLTNAEHEAAGLINHMDVYLDATVQLMVRLSGMQHEHGPEVAGIADGLADHVEKLAVALRAVRTPNLKLVDIADV